MRSQVNKVGTGYHVLLGQPTEHPTVTVEVPQGKGSAYVSGRGIVYGLLDSNWFSSQMMNIIGSNQIDASHLPIVLTDNVMLYNAKTGGDCCTIGYHGAAIPIGVGAGSTNGNGKQQVETGDPVVGIGFNLAGNSFKADQLADGTANKWDDGTWHPEDEVFLPWFARESPNRTSQQVQNGKYGRYTFWARSTRTPGSRKPATGC